MTAATDTVLAGRALAESVMQDTCTITRTSGPGTLNNTTLRYDPPAPTGVYSGPCRITNQPYASPLTPEAGDRVVYELTKSVSVPISVQGVEVGDLVTVTACPLDPSLVGCQFTVRSVEHKTFLTARRLLCEEVTA